MHVHAGLIIAVMVAVFVLARWRNLSTELAIFLAAVVGALFIPKACHSVTSWKVCSPILISASSLLPQPCSSTC